MISQTSFQTNKKIPAFLGFPKLPSFFFFLLLSKAQPLHETQPWSKPPQPPQAHQLASTGIQQILTSHIAKCMQPTMLSEDHTSWYRPVMGLHCLEV